VQCDQRVAQAAAVDGSLGVGERLRYTLLQLMEILMMNNEEFERKMHFIVEQQAQFASDIQQLQESQARTDQVVAQTAVTVAQMGDVVTRLATVTHAGFSEVNAKINALVDAQIRTEENLTRTEENLARIEANLARTEANVARTEANVARTEANVARTDENLRNLIAVVDRSLREGRNGG
jgi:septal ring factor EnvC (AmiA/AmiB activator)